MSFIQDEQGEALLGTDEVIAGRANASHHFGFAEGGLITQDSQDFTIQAIDAQGRIGQVDDQVAVRIQAGDEGAHGSRFAGANLTGDQANALFADQVRETSAQLSLAAGGEDILGWDVFGKRDARKAIELLEHVRPPPRTGQDLRAAPASGRTAAARPVCAAAPDIRSSGRPDNPGMFWVWVAQGAG